MKNTVRFVFALAAISILHGCLGRTLTPIDLAGSKADGTVVMGVVVGEFDEVNWTGAQGTALSRCRAWGYSSVSAFGGMRQKCVQPSTYGCVRMEITRTYQCVD